MNSREVLAAGHGVDQRGDRDCGPSIAEAAQAAGVGDLAGPVAVIDLEIGDRLVDRLVGDLDPGVAGREQADEHRAADRGVGVRRRRASTARRRAGSSSAR